MLTEYDSDKMKVAQRRLTKRLERWPSILTSVACLPSSCVNQDEEGATQSTLPVELFFKTPHLNQYLRRLSGPMAPGFSKSILHSSTIRYNAVLAMSPHPYASDASRL